MKNILFILAGAILYFSCSKKDNVNPQTVIQHDTITKTVTVHDTAYCTPKSDIIQGTWYYYGYKTSGTSSITTVSSQQFTFTQTTFNMNGTTGNAAFSSDYSYLYLNQNSATGTPSHTIYVYNCNELRLVASSGTSLLLRRTP